MAPRLALGHRRVVGIDVRGRGQSDAPENGYRWEDHYGDLAAMIAALGLDRPILVAFSRGSSYAMGYTLSNPSGVRGLVIGDYWARHVGLPPEFGEHQLAVVLRGVPMSERMPAHAVHGVARESREVPLWDRVQEFECPVLVIRGGRKGVHRERRARRAVGSRAADRRVRDAAAGGPRSLEPRPRRLPRGAAPVPRPIELSARRAPRSQRSPGAPPVTASPWGRPPA